ncbi:hypothetical protein ABH931_007951 [Streptacidiphilus sp. MAP12-33]|uniref:hypothetical protein n=1 Tax=Streptacidiphilus sp. MAP12-33 TaxID=3156266 RepID=UPI0035138493
MVAQLPHTRTEVPRPSESLAGPGVPDVSELRAVGAALLARLAESRERDVAVPDALWQAAERFQPLLDGVDPEPGEGEELWELALTLPGLLAEPPAAPPAPPVGAPEPAGGAAGLPPAEPAAAVAQAARPTQAASAPAAAPSDGLLVGDRVQHVQPRGA